MRTNIPVYFESARSFILQYESSSMCDDIYTGEYKNLTNQCKTTMDGIMSVGLSNAFYYMYSQILKANLKFYSLA